MSAPALGLEPDRVDQRLAAEAGGIGEVPVAPDPVPVPVVLLVPPVVGSGARRSQPASASAPPTINSAQAAPRRRDQGEFVVVFIAGLQEREGMYEG